jgi:predicted O-methyltransferase YrrM
MSLLKEFPHFTRSWLRKQASHLDNWMRVSHNDPSTQINRTEPDLPIILISSCKDASQGGDFKYNGGVKLYNLWVKLLRANGYQAFIVTYNGTYQPWLIQHQPHVSLDTVRQWKRAGFPLKFVTGWADATAFIDLADELYFYDCEIAWTSGSHFPILRKLMKSKIRAVATHSRTQQAWYMATFNRDVILIPIWSDETYWHSKPKKRKTGLVGYMNESPTSEKEVEEIAACCNRVEVHIDFVEIKGDECNVLKMMCECDLFIGLNHGKHPLWGEGSPLTQQEAMHAGCVVIAYDVHGNREYLIPGYSGFLAPRGRSDILADYVIELMRNPELKEQIRATSLDLAARAFTSRGRWPLLREFLGLEDLAVEADSSKECTMLTRPELEKHLGAPAYIGVDEIPVFAKYASLATETLVEIGAGYGSSAVLMLVNAPESATVHSIDPFVSDSMRGWQVSPSACRRNVSRALSSLQIPGAMVRWHLHIQPSYELARSWSKPIDFLYIDGDHSYEAVRRDFEDWFEHVRPGGWILLHDSHREPNAPDDVFARGWPGPTQLAHELKSRRDIELVEEVFSMTIWRRIGSPTSG